MSNPQAHCAAIATALDGRLGNPSVRRDRELHATAASADMPDVADVLLSRFGASLVAVVGDDRRADHGQFFVHYVFAHHREDWFAHVTTALPGDRPALVSLAPHSYPASRFERELRDMMGITPTGHPDPRPLMKHGFWPDDYFPLRKDSSPMVFADEGRPFPFGTVEGDGVYEIPVGPVHAGIIEPGHFRFSAAGETIIDVKQRLYFTHKGTEKLFEGRIPGDGVALAERISGDSTVGHALAFCQAVEAAAGVTVPPRAAYVRAVLLEMERIYNHVADFGMIISDTGFAVAHAHCYRIRERLLRLNHSITGNRLLRGSAIVGGVACDLHERGNSPVANSAAGHGPAWLASQIGSAVRDFLEVVDICLTHAFVLDRLETTGILDETTARDLGVRGYVARASGIDVDVRRDHPRVPYDRVTFTVPVFTTCDAWARAQVRVEEVKASARLIEQFIETQPSGALTTPMPALPPFAPAFAIVEGWRGAIVHWVMGDQRGCLARVKIVDPSFLNWPALSRAVPGNIVPDFPLCNKSFNMSYSGNDL